uniref:Uncharacterized protein n=1 Tax=Mucochytrium quahogii TaxID=96639 RepID=A0A7S2SMN1_9STRA|mmetsp:Transcript_19658/g.32308  ORF Transcript_19658/g.32308 Transcript_19658/m.32308 type:complete len:212 (-) Transcript_19658:4-639(-)
MKAICCILISLCLTICSNAAKVGSLREGVSSRSLGGSIACDPHNTGGLRFLFKFHTDNLNHKCVYLKTYRGEQAVGYLTDTISKSFWHYDDSTTWNCFTPYTEISKIDVSIKDCKCSDESCMKHDNMNEMTATIFPNQYAWVDYSASYYYFAAWEPKCSDSCNRCINPGDAITAPTKAKSQGAEGYYCANCVQVDQCIAPNPPVAAPTMTR